MNNLAPAPALPQAVRLGLVGFARPARMAAEAALCEAAGAAIDDPALWRSSELTGDGFPVELSFTTADDALRWTFDPAAHLPVGHRRPATMAALRRLGGSFDSATLGAALEGAGAQRFGAWLGGRHNLEADAYKLYLEWGEGPDAKAALSALGLPAPEGAADLTTQMLGLGPGATRCEVYHRLEPRPEELARLLAPVGLESRADELRDAIEASYGHPLRGRLPGGRIGVSYVVEDGCPAPIVTLYFFARILWGGDARIRARMIDLLEAAGRDAGPYAAASRALSRRNVAETRHGLVGLTLSENGLAWSVGVRPTVRP